VASISSAPAAGRGGGTHMSQQQQLDYSSYSRPLLPAAATLTMCPSCERVSTVADNRAAHTSNNLTKPAPAPALTPHLVQSSAACSWQLLLFLNFSSISLNPTTKPNNVRHCLSLNFSLLSEDLGTFLPLESDHVQPSIAQQVQLLQKSLLNYSWEFFNHVGLNDFSWASNSRQAVAATSNLHLDVFA
jgi:hypothetical protein